jgi:hypothetical protein
MTVADARHGRPSGKVRAARLTDLAALGELSRIAQTEGSGSRTLGLPVNGPHIGVFSLFRPRVLLVRSADGVVRCSLDGGAAACDGRPAPQAGEFVLEVPGRIERRFQGRLEIGAEAGALTAVIEMPLETAVASAVAAESPAGAPEEALRAQAVVARSYYLAAAGRHAGFDFCDTTHCQFLREPPRPDAPASSAAQRTQGLILTWRGSPIPALFSASCGGRTRALANPGADEYPYFAVDCPYCRRGPRVRCSYCDPRGAGAGHGFGLCQTGARGMAAAGAGFAEILDRYFPNAALTSSLP